MKPTVTFITPPSPFLMDERVFPSLGILKVAAVAERLGYPVEHLDLNGVGNYAEVLRQYLLTTAAKTFCLTATTPQMPSVMECVRVIRGIFQERARVVLGGPHPTVSVAAMRKEMKRCRAGRALDEVKRLRDVFDVIVAGDGEEVIGPVLGSRDRFIIDADNPTSTPFLSSADWARTPDPARHLIDMESYHYTIEGKRVASIVSQLGCPMSCHFCCGRDSGMLRRVRLRPTDSVIAEMESVLDRYPFIDGFMFMDDELNINKQMIELMQRIGWLQVNKGRKLANRGFVKAELFTQEQADAMAAAGFKRVLCGFESGSPRILENIKKNATVEENSRMLRYAKAAGLEVKALMSIGHAGETRETVEETVAWLLDVRPADIDVTIITTYPGSPYYDDAVRSENHRDTYIYTAANGDRLYQQNINYATTADYYKGDPNDGYRAYVWTDELSARDLVELRDMAEKTVRQELGIPFYAAGAGLKIEASMGQLPGSVYKKAGGN